MGSLERDRVLSLLIFDIVEQLGKERAKECLECILEKNTKKVSDQRQKSLAAEVAKLADEGLRVLGHRRATNDSDPPAD